MKDAKLQLDKKNEFNIAIRMGDMNKCESSTKIISAEFCSKGKCSTLLPNLVLEEKKTDESMFCIGTDFCISKTTFTLIMFGTALIIIVIGEMHLKAKRKKI